MAAQLAPWEAMLIPIFIVYRDTGGLDVLLALIPLYMVMVLPFTVWTMRGFIAAVPVELEEAALVDGCSRGQAFRRIVFPLLAPGVMATSLFGFITIWNEFVFVNALMQSEPNATLPLWISAFQTDLRHRLGRDHGGLDPVHPARRRRCSRCSSGAPSGAWPRGR